MKNFFTFKKTIIFISVIVVLAFFFWLFLSYNYHPCYYFYSPDGLNFTQKGKAFNSFGANSAIVLKDGKIALYGIDFNPVVRFDGITDSITKHKITDFGLITSSDGKKFQGKKITVKGLDEDIQTNGDATIVLLPDGNYRLYFAHYGNGPVVSLYSQNGYDFTYEGKLEPEVHFVDPTIIYEKRAQKYYIYTRGDKDQEIKMYESNDGRHFQSRPSIDPPFYLKLTIIDHGEYYQAYGLPAAMVKGEKSPGQDFRYPLLATSTDALNWQKANTQPNGPWKSDKIEVSASAGVKLTNGGYIFY
ncbi:MAG: Srx family chemoreceptor [Patescibacteria group bacterium]|nr:Srx family chemoreceptor [Patescibacteria group bacterium]